MKIACQKDLLQSEKGYVLHILYDWMIPSYKFQQKTDNSTCQIKGHRSCQAAAVTWTVVSCRHLHQQGHLLTLRQWVTEQNIHRGGLLAPRLLFYPLFIRTIFFCMKRRSPKAIWIPQIINCTVVAWKHRFGFEKVSRMEQSKYQNKADKNTGVSFSRCMHYSLKSVTSNVCAQDFKSMHVK